jgi:selenoprotein W-related protein
LAAAIKRSSGTDSKLIAGANGIFDVVMDGELIYSKHQTGQFPEDSEILDLLS